MVITKKNYEINEADENMIKSVADPLDETHTIPYKDWEDIKKSSKVYKIPIEYCKLRVENGRIKHEVKSYEKTQSALDQNADETQDIIRNFISKSEPGLNKKLMNALKGGQREPAVITSDGVLINGNRRKWALEELNKKSPNESYQYLKVVILPSSKEPDRPTIIDIVKLQNRYETQSDGKSPFSLMNKALTYYDAVQDGMNLEELLRDDPEFKYLDDNKFKSALKFWKKKNFKPIEVIHKYQKTFGIEDNYSEVEDKWDAFLEGSSKVIDKIEDSNSLVKYQIEDKEVPILEMAFYNMMKLSDHDGTGLRRRTDFARNFMSWVEIQKKDVLKIAEFEEDQTIEDPYERDENWQNNNAQKIISIIKGLEGRRRRQGERDEPLQRLEKVLKELTHKDLSPEAREGMPYPDIETAMKICNDIETENKSLKTYFYDCMKNRDKLSDLNKNRK